jgi:DNA topoisomerase-1
MKLIIVESPTKAKTISHFLKEDFVVESCNGHVRDLPKAKMGIDIENNFQPQYVVPIKKRKIVNKLKNLADKAEIVYFATDEDREGEAIAFHLYQLLKEKIKNYKRIVFHEITEEAIKEALKNPRDIDLNLVKAQEARRILDRLVGYELSPFLWKKIAKKLSAGRVQSPALRLIVEREREILDFKPEEYYTLEVTFLKEDKEFVAKLSKIDDKSLEKLSIKSKEEIEKILNDLNEAKFIVNNIEIKETKKSPPPPFTTSSLQQEANKKLGFSAEKTMLLAQQLYEGVELGKKERVGLITYMRTDSLNLADKFLKEVSYFIEKNYGKDYKEIKKYKTKSKVAQEAHEAIRPTSCFRIPEKIKKYLNKNQYQLYQLIWQRAISSQMKPAILINKTVEIKAKNYTFKVTATSLKFDGWLKIYETEKITEKILPPLEINEELKPIKIESKKHFTEPPSRYTDGSLVKTLESLGIGRPSTYALIISTLQKRNYVVKEKKYLKPTEVGFLVNDLLITHFKEIVDYQFTAKMEDDLDKIANGELDELTMIEKFYWPFKEKLKIKEKEISDQIPQETKENCPKCGKPLVLKMSRFGKFLACSGFPNCQFTKSINNFTQTGIKCPKCQKGEILEKKSKKGKTFYTCSLYPDCDYFSFSKPEIN